MKVGHAVIQSIGSGVVAVVFVVFGWGGGQYAWSSFRNTLLQVPSAVNRDLQYMLGAGAGAMEEVNNWHYIPLLGPAGGRFRPRVRARLASPHLWGERWEPWNTV